jgi:hypothetical protein
MDLGIELLNGKFVERSQKHLSKSRKIRPLFRCMRLQ